MASGRNYQRSTDTRRPSGRGGYRGTSPGRERGRSAYVYDNLARRLEEVPERREQPGRRVRRRRIPRQKPVAMPVISGASFLFLTVAAVAILVCCFQYLRVQANVTQMKSEIVTLQSGIAEARIANEEAKQVIEDTVDLSDVYEIATGELGMIHAMNNQVFYYRNKKSDMVKQYSDIPAASR